MNLKTTILLIALIVILSVLASQYVHKNNTLVSAESTDIDNTVNAVLPAAAWAIASYESTLLKQIGQGLLEHPAIHLVQFEDETNLKMDKIKMGKSDFKMGKVETKKYPLFHKHENKKYRIGTLKVFYSQSD